MERKKRILFVNESSFTKSGYAVYGSEVLKRLHETGKYELMELGCYGEFNDERALELPWRYMPVKPDRTKPRDVVQYEANKLNEFGAWRFEEACLAFKPDFVMDVRDWWMHEYQQRSPFRDYFNWVVMPTVDSAPQEEQWLFTYLNADGVLTYTDWGMNVLKEQTANRINSVGTAPPGADLKSFVMPHDKRKHKAESGIEEDCLIVGTVMRNQERKLYPDLVQAFAQFLKEAPEELSKKTFLYLHTAWPDLAWDIPKLIKEAGIGHKTLFTYGCYECGATFPAHFMDARAICRRCNSQNAKFPSTQRGISAEVLGKIMATFDVYVQYATCEGFGMPQVEAAACGVPVMSVDYSAMSDVVRKLHGTPIKVQRMFREPSTHQWRALPDNSDLVKKLIDFLQKPKPVRDNLGYRARKAVEEHYTYEKTTKVWMDYFDGTPVRDHAETWDSVPRIHTPNLNIPSGMSNEEFVNWGFTNIAGRKDLVNSYVSLRMIRDLNWGFSTTHMGGIYFNEAASIEGYKDTMSLFSRDDAVKKMLEICEMHNHWEHKRGEQKGVMV